MLPRRVPSPAEYPGSPPGVPPSFGAAVAARLACRPARGEATGRRTSVTSAPASHAPDACNGDARLIHAPEAPGHVRPFRAPPRLRGPPVSAPALGAAYARILVRELDRLARLVESYPDEAGLWRLEGSVSNSAGTLALHLAGNLEHFVGAVLGGTGYVRDREAEFGDRNVPRVEIVRRIRRCQETVREALEGMPDDELLDRYPAPVPASLGSEASAAEFLTHLTWHLGWHLGQIDYHRRILTGGEAV